MEKVLIRHRLDCSGGHGPAEVGARGLIAPEDHGRHGHRQELPDGRLRSTAEDGTDVDFRVSTLRTLFGEKVVMRVLVTGRACGAREIGCRQPRSKSAQFSAISTG